MTGADRADDETAAPEATDVPKPTRMVRLERQLGAGVTALLVGATVASKAGDIVAGKSQALAYAAIGLAVAAVLGAAVWYGQRMITSFAALAAGVTPLDHGWTYFALGSLGFGTWLMFRTSRAQAQARASRPRQPRQPRQARQRGRATTAPGQAVVRPKANSRYTPPKVKKTSPRSRSSGPPPSGS